MELARLHSSLGRLDAIDRYVGESRVPVVLSCADADTVMVAAALRAQHPPAGVWLEVSEDYLAQLAARDVSTLAWLVNLDHVVVAGEHARAQAEVVRALLGDHEVNFANEVAALRGAYNRPAPPHAITVWSFDGEELATPGAALHLASRREVSSGVVSDFA
ncbi:MAG TPA: hypothetical protein VMV53_07825 [Acidimicrobiales bacterium]|nr:hypothetical protein [Acidimicrobiales bacterium]